MSLIQNLTPAQALAQALSLNVTSLFARINTEITTFYQMIWSNGDQVNLSPPQAWAALGTNAVQARMLFGATVAFLNSIEAGSCTLAEPTNYTITQNGDGSITCVANS